MQGMMMQMEGPKYGTSSQYRHRPNSAKDHVRENVRRMRQIQKQCKQREQDAQQPVKVLWKSAKFTEVPSKIKDDIERPPSAPRPHSGYLRAHSRAGPPVKLESRPCTPDPELSVPAAEEAKNVQIIRRNVDFIKLNGRTVKNTKMQKAPSLTALDNLKKKEEETLENYTRGEVPKYLRTRKANWKKEEEDRIANTPDPAMPPGHRMMPETERRETLDLLQKKLDDLTRQLQALPLRNDTFRVRTSKQELETKIAEVEEAIKIFNRPKVFVKLE